MRMGGCGSVCSLPLSNRICSASSVVCWLCTGFTACSEMGWKLFCSPGLLYNKPVAFRSALNQHSDLPVSSLAACDLVSVILAVKVLFHVAGCVAPPQYQLLTLQDERLVFCLAVCSYFAFEHMLGDTVDTTIVVLTWHHELAWYHTV